MPSERLDSVAPLPTGKLYQKANPEHRRNGGNPSARAANAGPKQSGAGTGFARQLNSWPCAVQQQRAQPLPRLEQKTPRPPPHPRSAAAAPLSTQPASCPAPQSVHDATRAPLAAPQWGPEGTPPCTQPPQQKHQFGEQPPHSAPPACSQTPGSQPPLWWLHWRSAGTQNPETHVCIHTCMADCCGHHANRGTHLLATVDHRQRNHLHLGTRPPALLHQGVEASKHAWVNLARDDDTAIGQQVGRLGDALLCRAQGSQHVFAARLRRRDLQTHAGALDRKPLLQQRQRLSC